jgi:HEAT repeat protein
MGTNVTDLLNDKEIRPAEKRKHIADAIRAKLITIQDIISLKDVLNDKKLALVLESMEAVTADDPGISDPDWLLFSQTFISSGSNDLKREASRIVGNIAHLFPDDLGTAIDDLMKNTESAGTVIRWSSAYALSRIVRIPRYANSELYDTLKGLSEREHDNGIRNQLLNGLKKAEKLRS